MIFSKNRSGLQYNRILTTNFQVIFEFSYKKIAVLMLYKTFFRNLLSFLEAEIFPYVTNGSKHPVCSDGILELARLTGIRLSLNTKS